MLLEAVIAALDLLGAAAFSYIALRLSRLSMTLETMPQASLAFTLLAVAQVFALAAALGGGRLSYTAYVATASFSAAGFAILVMGRMKYYAVIPVALTIPLVFDLAAAATALASSLGFRGPARILVAGIGVTFLVRTAGLLLLPHPTGEFLLALGEAARDLGATILAVLYAAPSRR